jgi:hypothetical protein
MKDFSRRRQAGDPLVAGRTRLLYYDNQGTGPCRQGQYVHVHKLLAFRAASGRGTMGAELPACNALPGDGVFQLLIARETEGYGAGFEEWVLLRAYQGTIMQGVLQGLLFTGGAACRDYAEYQYFLADYRALKHELYALLESFHGPGPVGRRLLELFGARNGSGVPLKYLVYRLHGREFTRPLRRFAALWITPRPADWKPLKIFISGETYMRVSQAENIFRVLLSTLGFRCFSLEVTPLMSYLEYMLDEAELTSRTAIELGRASARRQNGTPGQSDHAAVLREDTARLRTIRVARYALRRFLARTSTGRRGCPCRRTTPN